MLYSDTKKFLFIHIPKTAGKSVKKVLCCYTSSPGPANFIARRLGRLFPSLTPRILYRLRTFDPHLYFREAEQLIPSAKLDACFKFCIVRNPYDRMVSYYNHIISHHNHPYHKKIIAWGSFEAMAIRLDELKEPTQLEYIKNCQGIPSMNFIGKYEHLDHDFEYITSCLGLNTKLPWVNASSNRAKAELLYSDIARNAVYNKFKEDFDYFEYPTLF